MPIEIIEKGEREGGHCPSLRPSIGLSNGDVPDCPVVIVRFMMNVDVYRNHRKAVTAHGDGVADSPMSFMVVICSGKAWTGRVQTSVPTVRRTLNPGSPRLHFPRCRRGHARYAAVGLSGGHNSVAYR